MAKFLKYFFLLIALLATVLIQQSFLAALSLRYAVFNLALVVILCVNFFEKYESRTGIIFAGLIGVLLDILSVSPFGVCTFTFILLGFLIKKATLFAKGSGALSFGIVFIFSFFVFYILHFLFSLFLSAIFLGKIIVPQFSIKGLLFALIGNFILAMFLGFVFKILFSLKKRLIYL